MTPDTRALVEAHWRHANAGEWAEFSTLLDPALRYDVPQTGEWIDSAEGYCELFRTWPGPWQAVVRQLVCEGPKAVCIIDFVVASDTMTGISLFEVVAGKIARVTDYWPEPYEPPPRATAHLKRGPA